MVKITRIFPIKYVKIMKQSGLSVYDEKNAAKSFKLNLKLYFINVKTIIFYWFLYHSEISQIKSPFKNLPEKITHFLTISIKLTFILYISEEPF